MWRQGGGSRVKEGRGEEAGGGGGSVGGGNMAAGVALAAPAREGRQPGLGPCGGSEHNSSAELRVARTGPERGCPPSDPDASETGALAQGF